MLRIAKILTLIAILLSPVFAIAKAKTDTTIDLPATVTKDTIRQRDLMDIFHSLTHSQSSHLKNDSVGAKPVVSMVPVAGYALQSRMAVLLSGNMAFRLSSNADISVVNF